MKIVFVSCVHPENVPSLFVMKFNENIYPHERVKISSLLNRSLQELQDLTPIVSLTVFFINESIFLLSDKIH
jgi:hypothetical protein